MKKVPMVLEFQFISTMPVLKTVLLYADSILNS